MKKLSSPSFGFLFVFIGFLLAFLSAAFGPLTEAPQPTPTPAILATADVDLEIGSTDGILIWTIVIAVVIILPLLWHALYKKNNPS